MANDIKIQLRQISTTTSEAIFGKHRVLVDRPVAKGGSDAGPMGGELFLASIGGCFMSNILAAIRAREARISDVQTEVTGTLADSPVRFSSVELYVTAKSDDPELLEKIVQIADRACIMMNTLRDKLELRIRVGAAEKISGLP
ncbi:MAG TPA: OsmC family protein [Bryobacteraceae bacterium]|nr:OsmC family protein [Bryobacteraceae bacterium]